MALNPKILTNEFSEKFDDYDKPSTGLRKWWKDLPYEGKIKRTAQWFNFKYRRYFEDPYYNIKYGVPNLFKYFSVVWKDRPWDSGNALDLMQRKFEIMIPSFEKYAHHVDSFQSIRQMRWAVGLIEKVKTEWYEMEYFDFEKRNFNFEPCEDKPGFSTLNTDLIWEKWDDYLAKYKGVVRRINKRDGVLPNKERLVRLVSDYNHERANRILFKLLHDHMAEWWS